MLTLGLSELQAAFRRAMVGDAEPALLAEIAEDGLEAAARLDIYRHHVLNTLTYTLMSAYPVVTRLVDRRFFAYAADRYIRAELPASPCLSEYGASFPAFLAEFPPCRDHVYLPDVARLEWAIHMARHAVEEPALDPARLAAVPAERTPELALRLQPSVAYLDSRWPVADIWRANRPAGDAGPVDLAAGPVHLEVRRHGDDVVFRVLTPATFAFRRALARGATLAEAARRALEAQSDYPLAQAVRDLLDEGIAVDCLLTPPPREV